MTVGSSRGHGRQAVYRGIQVLVNRFPTGMEVAHAVVRGNPSPAIGDGRSTPVGSAAIERFLRPVCYQDLTESLLPLARQSGTQLAWLRLRGKWCDYLATQRDARPVHAAASPPIGHSLAMYVIRV